jgi:type I restriction enzyme R subunit
MVKERYKDDSLNITDAGEKVKALINEHLIDLGINPKIPPNELLSDDFMAHVRKHSHGDPEAKASEMEHAIRKHCTIHFDEDPAFYKRLSDKMGKADPAAQKQLASAGRRIRSATQGGLGWPYQCGRRIEQGSATFYDHLVQIAFKETDDAACRDPPGCNRHHPLLEEAHGGKEAARQHRHRDSSGEYFRP